MGAGPVKQVIFERRTALGIRTAQRAAVLAGLTLACCLGSTALGQSITPTQSVNIPLEYFFDSGTQQARLGIFVGINGGRSQPYLFDTGSNLFNATFNPNTWGGSYAGQTTPPTSTVTNGSAVQFCYEGSTGPANCRGYTGNIIQVPSLSFFANAAENAAPVATFTATPGFQINAAYSYTDPFSTPAINDSFPSYYDSSSVGPQEGLFYGVFGARPTTEALNKGCSSPNCYNAGGVFGQVIVPGAIRQGYIVAANGQPNPANALSPSPDLTNPPYGTQTVLIGGQSQAVTPCSPCVTVGLTPELIGQFTPIGLPTPASAPGLIPWALGTSSNPTTPFPNPYGTGTGNNSAPTDGIYFTVTVTPTGGSPTTLTLSGLLDTGTRTFTLTGNYPQTSSGTITIAGATTTGASIPGLQPSVSTLTGGPAYTMSTTNPTNIMGIPFFMQNSVMFDLSDRVTGYTPFFVTDASLATTAGGPLVISGENVPLGLAGVISGPGGVTIGNRGQAQLSATNTYTGQTIIAGASGNDAQGTLYVSGPGSIAASSGLVNNGLLDISRAWAPVKVATLSGTGWVSLGGQNLTITNGSGTFSGVIADGGSYPANGGSVTIAAGIQTFGGTNAYTGGTLVSGGTLNLTGTMIGDLSVMAGATFTTTGGYSVAPGAQLNNAGTFQSLDGISLLSAGLAINQANLSSDVLSSGSFGNTATGIITGTVANLGTFANNGSITGNFTNLGVLSGNGTIIGNLVNSGTLSPGNSIGTANVSGNFTHAAGATYVAEVNSQGQSDRILTTGTATLVGSVLAQVQAGAYAPRTTYTIVRANGGIIGSFSGVTSNSPFLLPSLSYDATNVYLTLQIGGFGNVAQTPQQQAIANALDSTVATASGDYATVLSTLAGLTAGQVQSVLTSLSGTNYSGFSSALVQGAQFFMNNFAGQAGGGSPGGSRVALAEACDVACETTTPARWGAWGGAIGGLGTVGAGTSQGAVTYNAGGFAAGLDRAFADSFRAGVTVGYSAGMQWVSGFSGQGSTNTVQFGLYGNYAAGPVYADALLGYAYSANQMTRQIVIPGLQSRTAWGQTGANQFFGQLEAGYRVDIGARADAYVTPFARLQAYTGTQSGFTETGAQSLNLSVAQQTTNSLRSVIGAQLGAAIDMGWREKLALQFRLGWSHEYADVGRPVTAALAGAPAAPFTTFGLSPVRDGVLLGFGANTVVAAATSLYLRYEGTLAGQDGSHALTAGVRMTW
jgi:outer membrane autotransporter protein